MLFDVIITLWLIVLTIVVWKLKHAPSELAGRLKRQNDQLEKAIKPKQEK